MTMKFGSMNPFEPRTRQQDDRNNDRKYGYAGQTGTDEDTAWEKDEDIVKRREAVHSIWDSALSADDVAKQPVQERTKTGIDRMQQQTFRDPYRHDLFKEVRKSYDYVYGTPDGRAVRPAFGLKAPEKELSQGELAIVRSAPDEVRKAPRAQREMSLQKVINTIGKITPVTAFIPVDEDGKFGGQTSIGLRRAAEMMGDNIPVYKIIKSVVDTVNLKDELEPKPYNDKYKHSFINCEISQKHGAAGVAAVGTLGVGREIKQIAKSKQDKVLDKAKDSWEDMKANLYGIWKGMTNPNGNCDEAVQEKYPKYIKGGRRK